MANYVEPSLLKKHAVADEADLDEVFEQLSAAVSRMFDRECEVVDDFFAKAPDIAAARTFKGQNIKYLHIGPFIAGSITGITYDGIALVSGSDDYDIQGDYLIFPYLAPGSSEIVVTARFGFPAIPSDIIQACIEQALMQWRRKDLAFAELSGVSAAAVTAPFAPTFEITTRRYRDLYSPNLYFS